MRIFFLTTVTMIAITSYAQISSIKIAPKAVQVSTAAAPYDSLENISGYNYKALIGQTLFLRPIAEARKKGYYLYLDLLTSPSADNPASYYMKTYSFGSPAVSYSANSKYFKVLEMFEKKGYYEDYVFFKMIEKESGDTVYYRFPRLGAYRSFENFVVLGYYEKMKSLLKGNKLVYKNKSWVTISTYPFLSLQDGKKAKQEIPVKTIFECRDVTFVEDDKYSMVCILHNDTYGDFYVKEDGIRNHFITYDKYLEEQKADQQRKKQLMAKYGQKNGQLIFDGKVRIGFSKTMCKEAWGEPDAINTTTGSWGVHEQWVYKDGCYLYFENGKLTSIQN